MAAPAAQYQNVFQSNDFMPWVMLLFLGVVILTVVVYLVATKLYFRKKKAPYDLVAPIFIAFFCLALSGVPGSFAVMTSVAQVEAASRDAVVQDVKVKYGASVKLPDLKNVDDVFHLEQPQPYTLTFPDGTEGNYTVRFDRQTSEPFITEGGGPSAQELNQKAGK